MKKVLKTVLFLILLGAAAAAAFLYWRKPADVPVVHPARGPAVEAVYATGTVEASVMMPIAPRNAGRLVELNADEGDLVKKGTVLARLEDEDLRKQVEELQARVNLAQKEYGRRKILVSSGAISKEALDQAQAELDAAQAALGRAQANLAYMQLSAPADGAILRRDGEIGEFIPANQPVFWFSCCAGLRVAAEVDEEDIAGVKPGQKVVIRADAYPGEVFDGKVASITPKGDPVARSYRVRVSLPADTKLMIGMTAETNIVQREEKDALLIPASALRGENVYAVEYGVAKERKVKTGARSSAAVEIVYGLNEGDEIILNPENIQDGDKIKAKPQAWDVP